MTPALLALGLLAVAAAQGGAPTGELREGAMPPHGLGAVTGRVHIPGRAPDDPRLPLIGTSIVLVPRSREFLAELEAIRGQARASLNHYRTSVADLRRALDTYQARLRDAETRELVRVATADVEGRFALDDVPAGPWILVAQYATPVKTKVPRPAKPTAPGHGVFLPHDQVVGYQAVRVWLQELVIEDARTEVVDLTDRNGWLSGIEERTIPAPATGSGRRRSR